VNPNRCGSDERIVEGFGHTCAEVRDLFGFVFCISDKNHESMEAKKIDLTPKRHPRADLTPPLALS